MIFKEFGFSNSFFKIRNGLTNKLTNYKGEYSGYFQNHELGLIVFHSNEVIPFFIIDEKKFEFNLLQNIDYLVNGENRIVSIIGVDKTDIKEFAYKTFWFGELEMIEFALGFPEDVEKDLMKFITNKYIHFIRQSNQSK